MKKIILLAILSFAVLQLMGCASGPQIRADQSMLKNNPIQKIALIGTSTVYWPRRGNAEPYIGLNSSKAGIEKVLPMFKAHLKTKGYDVTFAHPIAVALPSKAYIEHLMFDNYGRDGDKSKVTNLNGNEPGFIYDLSNKKIQQAGIAIAFELNDALSDGKLATYKPSKSHIQTILTETNSDTVCQVRAYGRRYSDARAVGAFFLSMLSNSVSNTSDAGSFGFICSDKTSNVLWLNFHGYREDPMQAEAKHIEMALKNFPSAGATLAKTCVANNKKEQYFTCEN